MPSFLVVGYRASGDTDIDTLTPTPITGKFQLTGYFKLNSNTTYSCSGTMVVSGAPGISTTVSYSIVASFGFTNGSFIAFALRAGSNANTYDALVIKKYLAYTELSVLGVLDSNAGFIEFCKLDI
jgi:hypothetical protein